MGTPSCKLFLGLLAQTSGSAVNPSPAPSLPTPWSLYSKGKKKRSKNSERVREPRAPANPTTSYSELLLGK